MIATIRFTQGLGNAAIYVRARDASARFWDFQAEAWVSPETPACGVFLTEYPDSDPVDSLYQASIIAPAGEVVIEYVRASDFRVLGEEEVIDGTAGLVGLATLSDLKDYLSIKNTADDALLTRLLLAASSWFESQVGRSLASASRTEVQDGNGTHTIVPRHYPVTSVTGVTIDGVIIPQAPDSASDGWTLVEGVISLRGSRATKGIANVSIDYEAGYSPLPADVQQAVIEVAADRFRYRTRVGEVSKSVGGESVSFVSFQVPFAVQTVIDSYRRVSV